MLDTVRSHPRYLMREFAADRFDLGILFLSSREAGWITGLIMPIDAGVCWKRPLNAVGMLTIFPRPLPGRLTGQL